MRRNLQKIIRRLFGISDVVSAFYNAFCIMEERGFDVMYVGVDLHGTVFKPDYEKQVTTEFYDDAKRILKMMSNRPDIKLIMYTCSHPTEIEAYLELFKKYGIKIDFVNKNTEVVNTKYGDFTDKPYMNVLLEDKAGFDPHEDWLKIEKVLKKHATII